MSIAHCCDVLTKDGMLSLSMDEVKYICLVLHDVSTLKGLSREAHCGIVSLLSTFKTAFMHPDGTMSLNERALRVLRYTLADYVSRTVGLTSKRRACVLTIAVRMNLEPRAADIARRMEKLERERRSAK